MSDIIVQTEDFDLGAEYQALRGEGGTTGAISTFVGLVRDYGDGTDLDGLMLEHYPGMTEKSIQGIIDEAKKRWPILSVKVIHRIGELKLGEQIVFVGVSSSHRAASFSACEFIMDYLKAKAPFWKKEIKGSNSHWVNAKDTDQERARSWQNKEQK